MVKQHFFGFKNADRRKSQDTIHCSAYWTESFLQVTDKEMPQTVLQVMIKHPEEKLITEENYIHSMQRALFNEMIGERFAELAQKPRITLFGSGSQISVVFLAGSTPSLSRLH